MLAECWQNAINLHQNIEKKYNYFTMVLTGLI